MALKEDTAKAIENAFIALKDFTISLTMEGESSNKNYDEVSGTYKDIIKTANIELKGLPEDLVYSKEERVEGDKYDFGCVVLESALPNNFDSLSNLQIEIENEKFYMVSNKKDPANITRTLMLSRAG